MSDTIAGLLSPFSDTETAATVLKHLWHEEHGFTATVLIQCDEQFLFAKCLDEFSSTEIKNRFHTYQT